MRPRRLALRIGAALTALATAGILFLYPAAASAVVLGRAAHSAHVHQHTTARSVARPTARSPSQATPGVHQVVVDGHCQLVDDRGVPLEDPLYWQRTGHDPC